MALTPEVQAALDAADTVRNARTAWSYECATEIVKTAAAIAKATATPIDLMGTLAKVDAVMAEGWIQPLDAIRIVQASADML